MGASQQAQLGQTQLSATSQQTAPPVADGVTQQAQKQQSLSVYGLPSMLNQAQQKQQQPSDQQRPQQPRTFLVSEPQRCSPQQPSQIGSHTQTDSIREQLQAVQRLLMSILDSPAKADSGSAEGTVYKTHIVRAQEHVTWALQQHQQQAVAQQAKWGGISRSVVHSAVPLANIHNHTASLGPPPAAPGVMGKAPMVAITSQNGKENALQLY